MADDFETQSSPLDEALSALPTLPPFASEKMDANGIASSPALPTFAEYVDQNRNASDLFSLQEDDVSRLILTPPRIKVPDFAAKLVRSNQFNYERLMTATHDMGREAELAAEGAQPSATQSGRKLPSAYLLAQANATASMGTYQFHRAVTSNYMRKMLSLTYHQNTTLGTISTNFIQLGKVIENKLEAIKLNTAAPDAKKTTSLGMIKAEFRRQWTASTVETVRKGIASYTKPRLNKFVVQPLSRKTADFFANKNDLGDLAESARSYVSSLLNKTVSEIKSRADKLDDGILKDAAGKVASTTESATKRLDAYTPSEKTKERARRLSGSIRNILPSSSISDMINAFMDTASGQVEQVDSFGNPMGLAGAKPTAAQEPNLSSVKPGMAATDFTKTPKLNLQSDDYQSNVLTYLEDIANSLHEQLEKCCCGSDELVARSSSKRAPKRTPREPIGKVSEDPASEEVASADPVQKAKDLLKDKLSGAKETWASLQKSVRDQARQRVEPRVWNDVATRAAMAIPTVDDAKDSLVSAASALRARHVDAHTWNNTLTALASKLPDSPVIDSVAAAADRMQTRVHQLSDRYANAHTWNDVAGRLASAQLPTREDLIDGAQSASSAMRRAVEALQNRRTPEPGPTRPFTIGGYSPVSVVPNLNASLLQERADQMVRETRAALLQHRHAEAPETVAPPEPKPAPVSEVPQSTFQRMIDQVKQTVEDHTPKTLPTREAVTDKTTGLLISILDRLDKHLDKQEHPTQTRENDYAHLLSRRHAETERAEAHHEEQVGESRKQSGLLSKLLHFFDKGDDEDDDGSSKKKGLLDRFLGDGGDDGLDLSGDGDSSKKKTRKQRRAESRARRRGRIGKRRFRIPRPSFKGIRSILSRRPHLPDVKSGRLGYRVGGALARGAGGLVRGGLGAAGWGLRNVAGPVLGAAAPVVGRGLLGATKLGARGLWGATKFGASGLFGLGTGLLGLGAKGALGSTKLLGRGAWGTAKLLGKGALKLGKTKFGLLGLGAMGADMLTDHFTQQGSTANRLGKTASEAASWAAMGSIFGPWGTAIGGALGATAANLDLLSSGAHWLGRGMAGTYHAIVGSKPKQGPNGTIIPGGDGLWGRVKNLFSFSKAEAATTGTMAANATAAMNDMHNLATQQTGPIISNNPSNPSGFNGVPTMGNFDPTGITNFANGVQGMLDHQKITGQKAYQDVIKKLPKSLVDRAAQSQALQFTIWSTATQLGTDRAAKLLTEQYGDKDNDHEFLRKVFQRRAAQFDGVSSDQRIKGISQIGNEEDYATKLSDGGDFKFTEAASVAGAQVLPGGDASVFGKMNVGGGHKEVVSPEERFKRSKHAIAYFMSQGWSKEQALGMVANLLRESGLSPGALNPDGVASGLAQWRTERQKRIMKQFGVPSIFSLDFDGQLAAVNWELTQGPYKNVGNLLRQTKTIPDAVKLFSDKYEIPGTNPQELAAEAQKSMVQAKNLIKMFNSDTGSGAYWDVVNGSTPSAMASAAQSGISGNGAPAQAQTQAQTAQATASTTPTSTGDASTPGSRDAAASQIAASFTPKGPSFTQDTTTHALLKTMTDHLATQNDHLAAIRDSSKATQAAAAAPASGPSVVSIHKNTTNVHVDSSNQLNTNSKTFSDGLT